MKVNINGVEITLRYSGMRALMIYEQVYGKQFEPKGLTEILVYFYATVLASSKNTTILFDDFIDWIDNNPSVITEFSNWLTEVTGVNKYVTNNDNTSDEKPDPNA